MTTIGKLVTFNVEEWDAGNNEAAHFNQKAGWAPMGHTHYHEDAGWKELAFWREAHPHASLRLTQTITEHKVLATRGPEVTA
ncbi:hypothetical protein [Corynebacterium neomassiliense]|uniref:hypothetical protein n=1 Tax=Corynebacterium neomassiliense TaxID=2079482 RepID=UPI00192A36E2|nr:hypothetical protein [Corynebacterium neomassiliense]